jgi:hypothetical protein
LLLRDHPDHDQRPSPSGVSQGKHHAISKKALHKQGPVPTDHGKSRLPNAEPAQLVCQ